MPTNYLEEAYQTSVKFYASLTRNQAKGLDSIGNDQNNNPIYVEPGAVCFVSDEQGNSIFVNNRLFGDGANSGGGGGGITEVHLDDIDVVVVNNNENTISNNLYTAGQPDPDLIIRTSGELRTSNFLPWQIVQADGTFITDGLKVFSTRTDLEGHEYQATIVQIDTTGIYVLGSKVITQDDLDAFREQYLSGVGDATQEEIDAAEQRAKDYADTLIASVYKIKGSVNSYNDLANIQNPKDGDVYNVVNEYGVPGTSNFIPAGTNYVYVTENGVSRWDPLGGTINLSAYKTAANTTIEIQEALAEGKGYTDQKVSAVNQEIDSINAGITGINNALANQSNTISGIQVNVANNAQNISTNTQNINNIVTQLTWQ